MYLLVVNSLLGLIALALSLGTYAAECDHPNEEETIARCLSSDLYMADININLSYKTLAESLSPSDRIKLKNDELNWIRERNAVCRLSDQEIDREKWLKGIIEDHTKAMCVIRYSRARTVELNDMITRQKYVAADRSYTPQDYVIASDKQHESGLWYFETKLNVGELARAGKVVIRINCKETKTNSSTSAIVTVHPETENGEYLVGAAVDLERGKFYHSLNGAWQGGEPGGDGGMDMKLERQWRCGIESTEPVSSLVQRQYIDVNFGERPFVYALPSGYKPYRGEPIWIWSGVVDNGMRLSFDYMSFNVKDSKPTFTVRQEYAGLKRLEEVNLKYKSTQSRLVIDCDTMQVKDSGSFFVSERNTYVATSGAPLKVDQQVSSKGLLKSLCFMKQNNFDLPDIDVSDQWEPMLSPIPLVMKISEASSRRQYQNGYLLVKLKNEVVQSEDVDGEQSHRKVVISAFNCVDHSMHILLYVLYGEHGNVLVGGYYNDESSPPRLPQNLARYEAACDAMAARNTGRQ